MATDFSRNVLRVAVAQMCQNLGWNSVQSTAMEILTDVLERYMCEIGRFSCRYAEQFGRTDPNLDDLGLAIQEMGINLNEVDDYIKHVDPVPFAVDVPAFPVQRPNHLNFPKPNSRELREREEHVPPHLPPLNPSWNEEVCTPRTPSAAATVGPPQGSPKQGTPLLLTPGGSTEKRPFSSPIDGVSPVKKSRVLPDDVLHSHYEMKGVIMTNSGFLSPVKGQGKMPDARAPPKMPLYPSLPCTVTESQSEVSGSVSTEVRSVDSSGGDKQKMPVAGVVPSPKVKKNLSSFPKHVMKGTKSPCSPARGKSPGKSKSPKGGMDENGSKLKELLVMGDAVLDLTMKQGESGSRGEENSEIPSSPEHDLVIADGEDPEVKQRRLTSYSNTIDLVVRASREAIQKEDEDDRRSMIERLEKEKMQWFREQEQQIKQDIEVAMQTKKQLELERQQREHDQITEKEREAHIDDTINDVIANATAEITQKEDEESRREKDVYEFDDDDFSAVPKPSIGLHPVKPGEKESVKDPAKDTIKEVTSDKAKDVAKDISVSKDAKKSKSKKVKMKISTEPTIKKEPGLTDNAVNIKEVLKQKLHVRVSSPEPSGGHVEDTVTFAISARSTPTAAVSLTPCGTSLPIRKIAVNSPSDTAVAPPCGGTDKDKFVPVPPIRIEKTTLTIKKADWRKEDREHKKSKKKNKDKTKKHEKNKERREKEHSTEREERRKEKKRKKEERKKEKKSHYKERKSHMIPKLTFKFGSSSGSTPSISVCRSDVPNVAPPSEPVKLVIRPPVPPPQSPPDVKSFIKDPSPPPSPKSPIPILPSPQPSPPPSSPPLSPIRQRSPSPPPPTKSPTPSPAFTPSPARSATPTFIPSLPDSPSPTRSPEHIILRSPSRSISPEPLSHSPVRTPSPSPPHHSPTPPPAVIPSPAPSPPPPSPPPRPPPTPSPPSSPPPAKPSPAPSPPRHVSPPPPASPKPILLTRPTLAARKAVPQSQRKKQGKGKRTPSTSHVSHPSSPPPLPPTSAALAFQRGVISETQGTIRDEHGETIWICPACKLPDDGSPMIGCDDCPDWYHWVCVGIKVEPAESDNWYCPRCMLKQKGNKKKKQRRKKSR